MMARTGADPSGPFFLRKQKTPVDETGVLHFAIHLSGYSAATIASA